mmetsp:Transcript_1759/g.5350  ORF Transcript_1759/g.5350 Transcript_1759/m.5350 type:complete len:261 (+) Transcript_1759:102-884(+)|eukprot:CAMPEP_0198727522 /NCGR_PEP_ID=MMETSP1475-20131203/4375_1 /TAXON_ID= ORGANISM="Unidentified sp., Strain CCMP1999" /NCGR_SAMPLE_ID=MMETSP1475 /ASSEMBLY_ACC=CAM_ASM_001111 /LENGTH=260 /DNA_ID=CAMNT_0044489571 /DNA_START=72 /DNA_END=854 /DNA_ORIENTATION=-
MQTRHQVETWVQPSRMNARLGFVGLPGFPLGGRKGAAALQRKLDVLPARRQSVMCLGGTAAATQEVKTTLLSEIEAVGPDRGIFGLDSGIRGKIDGLLRDLEKRCPYEKTTSVIDEVVAGEWRVIYTTLTILGSRRAKLALATATKPGFVELGELYQYINTDAQKASNVVEFFVMNVSGTFTVDAAYEVESDQRVAVKFLQSELKPSGLQKLLGNNINLLTQIFNPEGHLDITYVDENLRIGRDHKEEVFVLVRVPAEES